MRRSVVLLLLVAVCRLSSAATTREGVFVGYKEVGVGGEDSGEQAGTGDGSLHVAGAGDGADAGAAGQDAGAQEDDTEAATRQAEDAVAEAAALREAAEAVGRTVLLHTQFGPIRVKLLEKLAPRTTELVWNLAEQRGCADCAFYRNEARPRSGSGPPYALLQGRLPDLAQAPPREGNIEVKMGHVCFIPGTKDFFIAYADHPEWETSHTVWGVVDEWFATDLMISQQYNKVTHPEYGTVMRMLKTEVPFKIAVEGDTTYSGLLGPLH